MILDKEVVKAIIDKLPMFEPEWSDRTKQKWFAALRQIGDILGEIENQQHKPLYKCNEHSFDNIFSFPASYGKHVVKWCMLCGAIKLVFSWDSKEMELTEEQLPYSQITEIKIPKDSIMHIMGDEIHND